MRKLILRGSFAALLVLFLIISFVPQQALAWDSYTKLMLHFNGVDESTTFTDEIGHTFTAHGNAQLDTAQKKFGTASGLFTPAAWLSGWTYRKAITVTNASADYQTKVLVGESSGATGEEVDCGGHVAADFDDLQFTAADGETLLDYWIESITGTTPNGLATVWVQNNATPDTTLYMYYGGVEEASSNGVNTFVLFDDFLGDALDTDKWDSQGAGSVAVSGGFCTLTNSKSIYSKGTYIGGYAIRTKWEAGTDVTGSCLVSFAVSGAEGDNKDLTFSAFNSAQTYFRENSGDNTDYHVQNSSIARDNSNHIHDIMRTGTADKFSVDGESVLTGNYPTNNARYIQLFANTADMIIDWILVRKYAATAPSFAFGSETTNPNSYIDTPDSADFTLGSGEFSIDFQVKRNTNGVTEVICMQGESIESDESFWVLFNSDDNVEIGTYCGGSTWYSAVSTGTITDDGNFHHIEFSRDNTGTDTLRLFLDGVADGTDECDGATVNNSTHKLVIGREGEYDSNYGDFWIDEFRLSVGICRHTSNFTPSTEEYSSEPEASVLPITKDFGIVELNTTSSTTIDYFTITNTGSVAIDVDIQGTDLSGGDDTWDLSDNATVGENSYGLKAGKSVSDNSTNSPSSNTGAAWTNPTNAYADGTNYANITSGNPSGSNVWGTYGFSLTDETITQVRVRYDAWSVGYTPVIAIRCQASGTVDSGAGSPYNATIPKPTAPNAIQNGDVLVMCLSIDDDPSNVVLAGWTIYQLHVLSTVDNSGAILYKLVTDYTSEPANYTVTIGDASEEVNYCIFALTNVNATIEDISFTGVLTSAVDTTPNVPAMTPATTGAFVVAMVAIDADTDIAMPGGTWATLVEDVTSANNLSICWKYGTASVSTGTADYNGLGSGDQTVMGQFGFRPNTTVEYTDQIKVDVSWNGGSNWSSTQDTTLTSSEVTTWYDVTEETAWTPSKLADGQLQVRALAQIVGNAEVVRLDWLPVEVTYTVSSYDIVIPESSSNELASNLGVSDNQTWGLQILMPSSVTDYDMQSMSSNVTLIISAH